MTECMNKQSTIMAPSCEIGVGQKRGWGSVKVNGEWFGDGDFMKIYAQIGGGVSRLPTGHGQVPGGANGMPS